MYGRITPPLLGVGPTSTGRMQPVQAITIPAVSNNTGIVCKPYSSAIVRILADAKRDVNCLMSSNYLGPIGEQNRF